MSNSDELRWCGVSDPSGVRADDTDGGFRIGVSTDGGCISVRESLCYFLLFS